jgi:hypothetical protein
MRPPLVELTTERAKLLAAELKAIWFSIPRKSVVWIAFCFAADVTLQRFNESRQRS